MLDEVEVVADQTPAPDQVATAAPAPEDQTPEVTDEAPSEKLFTQEELNAEFGKRLARERRKMEREFAAKQAEAFKPPVTDDPHTPEAQAEASVYQKAEQLLREREAQRQQAETLESYRDKEEEARDKYDDFEQVAYNPNLRITDVMAQTIHASEIGPDVAYFLGANPKEADRISRLQPFMQAKEIGKLEAKLADNPVVKKTTSAPPPLAPVNARSSGARSFDTTDPRSIKTMSASEWIAADRARQMKKLERNR
jgi:hypothetical protein